MTEKKHDILFAKFLSLVHEDVIYSSEFKSTSYLRGEGNIPSFTLTDDEHLPEWKEKKRMLNELIRGYAYDLLDTNQKMFLFYFVFFFFLYPETSIVKELKFFMNIYDRKLLIYLQILFKEIVEKLGFEKEAEIVAILASVSFSTLNEENSKDSSSSFFSSSSDVAAGYKGEGGSGLPFPFMFLLVISIFVAMTNANAHLKLLGIKLISKEQQFKEVVHKMNKLGHFTKEPLKKVVPVLNEVGQYSKERMPDVKEVVHDLTNSINFLNKHKELVFIKSVRKNFEFYLKQQLFSPNQKFQLEKIIDMLGAVFDTVGLLNVFQSNKMFTVIKDFKKVSFDVKDMFLNKFKYSTDKNIIFLGNIAKFFLHGSICFQKNFVLILEATSSLGAFTNLLSSMQLLMELHDDAMKTAGTFSAKEKEELLFGDLDIPEISKIVPNLNEKEKEKEKEKVPLETSSLVLGGKRKKTYQTKKKTNTNTNTNTNTKTKTKSTKHTRTKRKNIRKESTKGFAGNKKKKKKY
jgi:hypothetical protein